MEYGKSRAEELYPEVIPEMVSKSVELNDDEQKIVDWFKDKYHFSADPFVKVYTTRVDTVYSMAFVVIAPDHPRVSEFITDGQREVCMRYIEESRSRSDIERTETKEKTGVFTGSYLMNPYNHEKVPLWIGDFVLGNYGTGCVFGDAHDERDLVFAKKHNIPLKISVRPTGDARYMVIEKSLSHENVKKLEDFGSIQIEKEIPSWGKFIRVNVAIEKEPDFIAFLERNLLSTGSGNDDTAGWYADSIGTTNILVFP